MRVVFDMPEIEGFEHLEEYREPLVGEFFMDDDGTAVECGSGNIGFYPILRKLEPKRVFRDGAFYPGILKESGEKHVIQVAFQDSSHVAWNITYSPFRKLSEDFSWIGEELNIKWEEV
jgi:hypothetical protein